MRLHLSLVLLAACSSGSSTPDGRPPDSMIDAAPPGAYRQVEHLARPGIAEALLVNNALLASYNAAAPTFAGLDQATVMMVKQEAQTVLEALYLGACLVNGLGGFTAATGVKPAGTPCHAVGTALFDGSGNLTAASMTSSQAYADKVYSQLLPDVMRIDLGVASTYLDLCAGAAANVPLLCGGRLLQDDAIDVTYDYLLNGGVTIKDTPIISRLVSDGVTFSSTEVNNRLNRTSADPTNAAQGHPNVSSTVFPYAATPL